MNSGWFIFWPSESLFFPLSLSPHSLSLHFSLLSRSLFSLFPFLSLSITCLSLSQSFLFCRCTKHGNVLLNRTKPAPLETVHLLTTLPMSITYQTCLKKRTHSHCPSPRNPKQIHLPPSQAMKSVQIKKQSRRRNRMYLHLKMLRELMLLVAVVQLATHLLRVIHQ